MNENILVTKPFIPPLKEYNNYLKKIWKSGVLTHNGPLVQKLEKNLIDKYNLNNILCLNNGTLAIHLSIKALELNGEIITTPFTFIATISSIIWEKCTPVFVDINPETFNIDENKIEDKINKNTKAILAVHVFSNPCNIEKIEEIAKKYNLKTIYDAAHAFSVNYKEKSILNYGDISTVSFHATKLFNTGEGGACVSKDILTFDKLKALRFFGYDENKLISSEGTNAKMIELQAAMGLSIFPYIEKILEDRKKKYFKYIKALQKVSWINFQKINENSYNFSYMPVLLDSEQRLLKIIKKLNENYIFPRRYFSPSLDEIELINPKKNFCPISRRISKKILCLPLYYDLEFSQIEKICRLMAEI